jgi:hypothetical protein
MTMRPARRIAAPISLPDGRASESLIIKHRLQERLEDAGTRRIRGIAAQTLLLAFQLAHANRRKLASWADAIALGGERPRRRPTRRRRTKPLGTWTPKGHITQR